MHLPLNNIHLLDDSFLFLGRFGKLSIHGVGGFSYSLLYFFKLFHKLFQLYLQNVLVILVVHHHLRLKTVQGLLYLSLVGEIELVYP